MDSRETWWTGWECHSEELIQFWWRSKSRSGYENYLILSDSSPLSNGAKNNIAWYLKKLWTGSVCDKDQLIRFWWRSDRNAKERNRNFVEKIGAKFFFSNNFFLGGGSCTSSSCFVQNIYWLRLLVHYLEVNQHHYITENGCQNGSS